MKSNKASLALGLVIMVVSAIAVYFAKEWPVKAALFPLSIGIPLFWLAAAEVILTLRALSQFKRSANPQNRQEEVEDAPTGKILSASGWVLGFAGIVVLLGFPLAIPLYVFAYVKTQGRSGWVWSGAYAFAIWAVFYGVFDQLLHLPFPAGWLQTFIGLG